MEISTKNVTARKGLNGLLKLITTLHLDIAMRLPSSDALPNEIFAYGVPYEVSETCRKIRCEFENNKSVAMIEVRQALFRC